MENINNIEPVFLEIFREVDGNKITLQEFQEMATNTKIQLREVSPGIWKTFQRLYS
jgi:hypothetical protein